MAGSTGGWRRGCLADAGDSELVGADEMVLAQTSPDRHTVATDRFRRRHRAGMTSTCRRLKQLDRLAHDDTASKLVNDEPGLRASGIGGLTGRSARPDAVPHRGDHVPSAGVQPGDVRRSSRRPRGTRGSAGATRRTRASPPVGVDPHEVDSAHFGPTGNTWCFNRSCRQGRRRELTLSLKSRPAGRLVERPTPGSFRRRDGLRRSGVLEAATTAFHRQSQQARLGDSHVTSGGGPPRTRSCPVPTPGGGGPRQTQKA